ncbi:MAG: sigma-54 dependent transcriptional regulator [Pseudomonadota bacterium]
MKPYTIFIVDDQENVRKLISCWIDREIYQIREFEDGHSFLASLDEEPDAVCLDLMMPGMDGMEVLKQVRMKKPDLPVIMVTAAESLETAVEAMKQGAYDFITKPIDRHRLRASLKKAVEKHSMTCEISRLRKALGSTFSFDNIIGKSDAMKKVFSKIENVLETNINVFITGESGTGKEMVARAIHFQGGRRKGPFEAVNCGAIPENLQESEFFGHEKGAFTSAVTNRIGKIETAEGGTLFLDEVGEMSPSLQIKLLRFLQDKTFERVGGRRKMTADVRIISATNKDLEKEVQAGNFREDLYYRLVVFPILLPPLRERKEDVPVLVDHFLDKYSKETGKDITVVDNDAMEALIRYSWPGNVRELENVVFRSVVAAGTNRLMKVNLPDTISGGNAGVRKADRDFPERRDCDMDDVVFPDNIIISMPELEKKAMRHALSITNGNLTLAAKKLAIGRATFYRKLERYKL